MQLNKALETYLDALRGEVSESTRSWYQKRLTRLVEFLGPSLPVATVTLAELRHYRASLLEQNVRWADHPRLRPANTGLSIHTVHGHVRAVRRFFAWLVEEEVLAASPAARLKLPKLPDEPPKDVSRPDFSRILRAAQASGPRDLAMVLFLADTGCRVAGLVGLRLDGLELEAGEAVVLEKGQKTRAVYFGELTAAALIEWLAVRPGRSPYVFVSYVGEELQTTAVNQLLDRLAAAAGVTGRHNPHSFRHGAARRWLREGMDLTSVSRLLGHSDIVVTARSYGRWETNELQDRHKRFSGLEDD